MLGLQYFQEGHTLIESFQQRFQAFAPSLPFHRSPGMLVTLAGPRESLAGSPPASFERT
jgi:hypothetical protein